MITDILFRYSVPLHIVDINVSTRQGIRVLSHGLLCTGNIVGDDFVGVVLDGARRVASACWDRYVKKQI